MANTRLGNATFVTYGYGQVEDNHLTAPRNGGVYAQLPADSSIDMLENGQFVRYDKAAGVCVLPGGDSVAPIMMVFNEIKIYRDRETDADFAMIKGDYNARIFSPIGQTSSELNTVLNGIGKLEGSYEPYDMKIPKLTYGAAMPEGSTMVPRVFKMSVGDIYTTNCINETSIESGDLLYVEDGYLTKTNANIEGAPVFQIAKVYTMPDNQPGAKLQCIKA